MTLLISKRIDIFRGFLCQYVIFSHLIPTLFPGILGTPGTLAVWCFFIVSGYLNSISLKNSSTTKEYFMKRINRLYPLLLLSYLVIASLKGTLFINDFWTLIPAIIDIKNSMPVNGVLWTLIIELQLYLLTPFFCRLRNNLNIINHLNTNYIILIFSFLSLLLSIFGSILFTGKIDLDDRMVFFSIPFYFYGIVLANLESLKFSRKIFFYSVICLFIIVVYSRNFGGLWNHLFLEGRLIPFLITSLVLFTKRIPQWLQKSKPLTFFGKATFEIYLFHGLFAFIYHHFFINSKSVVGIFIFYWVIPTILGLSIVMFLKRKKKTEGSIVKIFVRG